MTLPIIFVVFVLDGPVANDFGFMAAEHHQNLLNNLNIKHERSQSDDQSCIIRIL